MANKKRADERKVDVFAQKQGTTTKQVKDNRKRKQSRLSQINEAMNW